MSAPPAHPARPDAPSSRARAVLLVALIAYGLVTMTICLPSMQEWGAILDASPGAVQLTFSAFVLAYGALQLLYGPLSDRLGRRPLMLVGLAVAGVASAAGVFATGIEALVAARTLQGVGCAACAVLGRAAIQDAFEGTQRTRVMAQVGMAMGLCPPLATVIGGQLHARIGWQANFVLLALMAAALAVATVRDLPAVAARPRDDTHWLNEMGDAFARLGRERAFVLNVAVLALSVGAFYAFLAGAPLVLKAYGVGPGEVGFYVMVAPLSYVFGNFLTSRLARYGRDMRMRAVGQALTLTGILAMIALALLDVRSGLAFTGPLVLFGIGHGLLMPPTLVATVGLLPALAGAAAGIAGVSQQLVGAVGGYAVGWVPQDGPVGLGLLMAAFTLGAIVAQAMLPHGRSQ
ncbi:MAG: Bcr/CflA family efflux MFS transporter [Burkholderiales bacterium]|nr:Bcr/CflA family efflux MFS transporter [Burkholderiales bacterium]